MASSSESEIPIIDTYDSDIGDYCSMCCDNVLSIENAIERDNVCITCHSFLRTINVCSKECFNFPVMCTSCFKITLSNEDEFYHYPDYVGCSRNTRCNLCSMSSKFNHVARPGLCTLSRREYSTYEETSRFIPCIVCNYNTKFSLCFACDEKLEKEQWFALCVDCEVAVDENENCYLKPAH